METILKMKTNEGKNFVFTLEKEYTEMIEKQLVSLANKMDSNLMKHFTFSEIRSSLEIENDGSSRKRINELLVDKKAPQNEVERKLVNLHAAYSFIESNKPSINKDNLMTIYKIITTDIDMGHSKLEDNNDYRQSSDGEVAGFSTPDKNIVSEGMKNLFDFINSNDSSPIIKAYVAHIIFIYYHPFYDFNGRTGRLLAFWILTNNNESKLAKIFHLSLPNSKKTYLKFWNQFRKFKNNDITGWIEWFAAQTINTIGYLLLVLELSLKSGIKLNETENIIMHKLILNKEIWYDIQGFEEIVKLGISVPGMHKTIQSLLTIGLIETKISKKTTLFKLNENNEIIKKYFAQEHVYLGKPIEKYIFESGDFATQKLSRKNEG